MKIGIDIDEVIVEYLKDFLLFVKEKTGKTANLEEFQDYLFTEPLGITLEESRKLIIEHTDKSDALINLELVKGAKDSINLLDKSHEIFFITARHLDNKLKTQKFFELHFPKNDFKIFFSGDVWGKGDKSKSEICSFLGIEILLEDNKNYSFECAKNGIKVILLDKPWNKDFFQHENIFKVNDWKEALEKIKEIENALAKN